MSPLKIFNMTEKYKSKVMQEGTRDRVVRMLLQFSRLPFELWQIFLNQGKKHSTIRNITVSDKIRNFSSVQILEYFFTVSCKFQDTKRQKGDKPKNLVLYLYVLFKSMPRDILILFLLLPSFFKVVSSQSVLSRTINWPRSLGS